MPFPRGTTRLRKQDVHASCTSECIATGAFVQLGRVDGPRRLKIHRTQVLGYRCVDRHHERRKPPRVAVCESRIDALAQHCTKQKDAADQVWVGKGLDVGERVQGAQMRTDVERGYIGFERS
jgi:hypothetical protein